MRPYQLKSATKDINGEPLPGWGVYCNGEFRLFVNAFQVRSAIDFVNHINEAFYIFDMHIRNNKPSGGVYGKDPLACSGCVSGCFRCLMTLDKE